jgi:hypothetical protein
VEHTDTQYLRVPVYSTPVQVVGPANRKRLLTLNISTLGLPIWVGENEQIVPGTGRIINRWTGTIYPLGPNQPLYAVTIGPFAAILHGIVIDRNDEGRYTDDGSGDEGPGGSRGSVETSVAAPPRPGAERATRI